MKKYVYLALFIAIDIAWACSKSDTDLPDLVDDPEEITKDQTIGDYQFKSGNEKIVSLSNPNGMNVKAKALSANNKVNFFVRIWRWIFGRR